MARRVRQTPSRGSKRRSSPVAPDDVVELAKSTSFSEVLVSLDVPEVGGGHAGDFAESQINGRGQASQPEQHGSGTESYPPQHAADEDFIAAESFDEVGYLRLNPDVRRETTELLEP